MRKILLSIAVCFVAVVVGGVLCIAGVDGIQFSDSNIATNGAVITTNTSSVTHYGFLDSIMVDFGGQSSPTVDVDVVTVGDGATGPSRTLLSVDNLTADSVYQPRIDAQRTDGGLHTNQATRIPLVADKLYVYLSNANKTGVTATVYCIFTGSD